MPLTTRMTAQGDKGVPIYWHIALTCNDLADEASSLRAARRSAALRREEHQASQKATTDREAARRWSDLAKREMRVERACSLALGWIEGDGKVVAPPCDWPVELCEELDEVLRDAMLSSAPDHHT
jgi:hypothetical protein